MLDRDNIRSHLRSQEDLPQKIAEFIKVCPHVQCADALLCVMIDEGFANLIMDSLHSLDQLWYMTNMRAIDDGVQGVQGIVGDFVKRQKISHVIEFMNLGDTIVSKWIMRECALSYSHHAYELIALITHALDPSRLDDAFGTVLTPDAPTYENMTVSHLLTMPHDEVISATCDSHLILLYQIIKSYQINGYAVIDGISSDKVIDLRRLPPPYEDAAVQLINNIDLHGSSQHNQIMIDVTYDISSRTMSPLTRALAHHLLKLCVTGHLSLTNVYVPMILPLADMICGNTRDIYKFVRPIIMSMTISDENMLDAALILFNSHSQI